jgi:hypothetical protein
VVGDHHGEPGLVLRQDDRAAPRGRRPGDRHALTAQVGRDRVREPAGPVHLDPFERFGQDVDHRG